MAVRSLRFVLTGDDKSASKSLDKVGKKADGLGRKLGGLATLGAAGLGAGAVVFAKSSLQAYAEAEKAQAALQQSFKKFPKLSDVGLKSMQDFNSGLATKTKFDDDAIASGESVLATFGLTGKQIKKITPLLLDYATATGKDLPEAARDLGKASQGQFKALKNVGLQMKDLKDPTKNLAQLMDGLNKKVGGLAGADAKTASGQMEILKNRFGELKETVGEQLMPVVSGLVKWLNDKGVPALQKFADGFKDGTGAGGALKDLASDLGSALNDYVLPVFKWFADHPDAAKFLAVAAVGGFAFVKAMKGVAALQGAVTVLKGIGVANAAIATSQAAVAATAPGAAVGIGAVGTAGAGAAVGLAAFATAAGAIAGTIAIVGGVLYLINKKSNSPESIANLNAGTPSATIPVKGKQSPTITFNGQTFPVGPIPAPTKRNFGLARGGAMKPGFTYLTGEEGPELITAKRGGYVHTAQKTRQMFNPKARLDTSQVRDDRTLTGLLTGPLSESWSGERRLRSTDLLGRKRGAMAPAGMKDYINYRTPTVVVKVDMSRSKVAKQTATEQRRRGRNGHPLPFGL